MARWQRSCLTRMGRMRLAKMTVVWCVSWNVRLKSALQHVRHLPACRVAHAALTIRLSLALSINSTAATTRATPSNWV